MAIKSYSNKAAYTAAVKPTNESQVSMIEDTKEICVDGVNVITTDPSVGDVLFLDDNNNKVFLKGGAWLQRTNINAGWTHVGYVYYKEGSKVGIVDKTAIGGVTCTAIQYDLNQPILDGVEHTGSFSIYLKGGSMGVSFTYTATTLSQVLTPLNAAIDAKLTEIGSNNVVWAFLANAVNDKVDSDAEATKIVIQNETVGVQTNQNRWYSGVAFSNYIDWPKASFALKRDGGEGGYYGGMISLSRYTSRLVTYGRTPTAMEPIKAGNVLAVKRSCFENPQDAAYQYTKDIRDYYGTYENYIKSYGIMYPSKYGAMALPSPREISERFADQTFSKKDGSTMYKYPLLHGCYNFGYGVSGLDVHDWVQPSLYDLCRMMNDDTMTLIEASMTKMNNVGPHRGSQIVTCDKSDTVEEYYRYNFHLYNFTYGSDYNYAFDMGVAYGTFPVTELDLNNL